MHKMRNRGRRRGVVIIYVALAMVVLLGAAGLSIDVGNLYLERDKAQRAADAAALAGAIQLMNKKTLAVAEQASKTVAAANGYDVAKGATVICTPNADGMDDRYRVYVSKQAPVFFMSVLGFGVQTVGAPATATYISNVSLDINGGGVYGANGKITLSLFGPDGYHAYGDNYSTKKLSNGDPNPLYEAEGKYGYDFDISIPPNYAAINGTSKLDLQIFDPDTYNVSVSGNANGKNALWGVSIDEIRKPGGGESTDQKKYATTTKYTLYDTKGDNNASNDVVIATATYGNDPASDMTWVTPSGFAIDIKDLIKSSEGTIGLRLNVQSIGGSSENGFNLRAGPPITTKNSKKKTVKANVKERIVGNSIQYKYVDDNGNDINGDTWMTTNPFNSNNGTNITADGKIPLNFNENSTATITLGYVPAGATSVTIAKFDTDVGSQSVKYYIDGIYKYTGKLSGNDETETDVIDLPANYSGGTWSAQYKAGLGDTSVWKMQYTGPQLDKPGGVRLIK